MKPQTLSAHEYPLGKVFTSDFEFNIPDYQRPYRWGTDQATQLLDDLEDSLDRDGSEPYFLGSLVLVQQGDRAYDVIDGQQRLTTLTILFSILRDLARGDLARELSNLVREPGSELAELVPRPRLTLRAQDAKFFRQYVQEPGRIVDLIELSDNGAGLESQRMIRNNARALYERLAAWDDSKRKRLATLATNRTFLVVVTTPNLDSAYRIFSVMNARGLDLAPTDIFKSMVIGKLPDSSEYSKSWENAEETLGTDNFTDLFRDIRTVVNGDRARRELLKEFPEQVLDDYLEDGRAADFVDDVLLPYAQAFERTIAQDFGPGDEWAQVNRWLTRLSRIDNKDWRPPALWAIKHYPDDAEFLSNFLRKLERVAAVSLLRGEYTTPRIGRYLDILRELKSGAGLDAPSLEPSPQQKDEARASIRGEVYRMQTQRARYVLLRLDELLAQGAGATYEHSIISIEHVLPQSPAPDSQWVSDFTEDERLYWTHRLGNLLLLNHRKNAQARNFDFGTKKQRYFRGNSGSAVFALTTQVLSHDTWTPAVIEERQEALSRALIDEWNLQ
jgi:hypothetical protein